MNPAQKNRVRAALLALNKTVRAVDEAAARGGGEEVLYRWTGELTPEAGAEVRALTTELRAKLADAARAQELEPELEDPLQSLSSRLSALWVELEDAKAKGLRAYGPVPPGLEKTLDPALDELERLAARLQAVLARGSR